MERLINAFKLHAGAMDAARGQVRMGVVQSINPADHTARVLVQPEGELSGWLPILAWQQGLCSPPSIGAQVKMSAQEGDGDHYVVDGIIYSDANRPPTFGGGSAQAGEFLYVNPTSGAALYINNGGTITAKDASGSSVTLSNNGTVAVHGGTIALSGNVTLAGTLAVTGEITVNGTTVVVP